MALTLYRRHRTGCEAGHPEDHRSSQLEENREGWKRCGCKTHVSGTLAGKFGRKNIGTHIWDEASQWSKGYAKLCQVERIGYREGLGSARK